MRSSELNGKKKKLERLGIPAEEYLRIRYLESEYDSIRDNGKRLSLEKEEKAKRQNNADLKVAKLSGNCETKREDMRNKGVLLLDREDIHGYYKEREDKCRTSMRKLADLGKTLENTTRNYREVRDKIEDKLRDSKIKDNIKIWDKDRDVEKGFREVSVNLLSLQKRLTDEKIEIQQNLRNLKDDYKEKHQHLTSILYHTEKTHDSAEKNAEKYY